MNDKKRGYVDQSRYRKNHLARGLCQYCNEPLITKRHCARHAKLLSERVRKSQLKRKSMEKKK